MTTNTIHPGAVISARHVSKTFGRRVVLQDVSLDVAGGEIVGIIGENGSGKTTLLRILLGLLPPTTGEVVTSGRIGYCPQEMTVFERLTVAENFTYFAAAYGLVSDQRSPSWHTTMDGLLRHFQFEQHRQSLVSHLSGGTKQKLNLALALMHEPDVLVLDEPYAGLDWQSYVHFWSLADELRSGGVSLLIVSHFVYDRSRYDRILDLKDGRL